MKNDFKKYSLIHFFQLIVWKYFPFARPQGINISGKIIFNRYSKLAIQNNSTLIVDGDLDLTFSELNLQNSVLNVGKLVMNNATIKLEKSKIIFGQNAHLKYSDIHFIEANVTAGSNFRLHDLNLVSVESEFNIGDYFFGQCLQKEKSWSFKKANFSAGNNCRIQGVIHQSESLFSLGSHSFINEGTLVSCLSQIKIGEYVMISYDCMLMDNNSHQLDYRARRKEIDQGFPNGTLQLSAQLPKSAPLIIGNDVWIGARSTLLKGVNIGNRAVIASNSVITHSVSEQTLAYGTPTKYKPL
jgi:acetyltransferase-like isoleucine patch superfamily enzyme